MVHPFDKDSKGLSRRAFCAAGAWLLLPWEAFGQATQPATRPAPSAAKLSTIASHADALIARAVRTQSGWGWADEEPGVDLTRGKPQKNKIFTVSASQTASIGLLLDLSGEVCRNPAFHAAAVEAGHGVAALMTRAGQIRNKGQMGVVTAPRDDATDVPDRTATRMSLALFLHLLDVAPADATPDARIKAAALRTAHWLGKQQNRSGGWATLYPPDSKDRGQSIIRLDTSDFRDTALAVLLASDLLADQQLENYFDRAVEFLLPLRIAAGRPYRKALWGSAYRLDGDPATKIAEFPAIPDLLATRRVIDILLGGHLVLMKAKYATPMKEVRDAVTPLEKTKTGDWYRRYDLALKPYQAAATQPTSMFEASRRDADVPELRTAAMLSRVNRVLEISGKEFHDEINKRYPIRRRLELMIAGFADDALVTDMEPAGATRSTALAGSGGLAETIDALWYELRTIGA
jgi:hypothetical protein